MKISSLAYHDVILENKHNDSGFKNSSAISYKIDYDEFELQINKINEAKKFIPVTINDLVEKNLPDCFMLTFDDGGVSAFTSIKDILDKYKWKGHFFITGKYINKKGFLSTEQIIQLKNDGHIIGSHSWSHPLIISSLNDDELNYEWKKSIDILEDILNEPIITASIPGGFFSNRVAKSVINSGVKFLFTSEPVRRSYYIQECQIFGRFSVKKNFSNEQVISLIKSSSLEQYRQYIFWQYKKLGKTLLGKKYITFRRFYSNIKLINILIFVINMFYKPHSLQFYV
jgi:peptidoglycan/xylan/chitin deacetylase (PgdA/CDA1 family)